MAKTYSHLTDLHIVSAPDGGQLAILAAEEEYITIGYANKEAAQSTTPLKNFAGAVEDAGYEFVGQIRVANLRGDYVVRVGKK